MTIARKSEKLRGKLNPYEWAKKYLKKVPKEIIPEEEKGESEKTNIYKKTQGLDLDKTLEPVPCDKCGKETVELKMIPMDLGQGLQYVYHCNPCLLGKNEKQRT